MASVWKPDISLLFPKVVGCDCVAVFFIEAGVIHDADSLFTFWFVKRPRSSFISAIMIINKCHIINKVLIIWICLIHFHQFGLRTTWVPLVNFLLDTTSFQSFPILGSFMNICFKWFCIIDGLFWQSIIKRGLYAIPSYFTTTCFIALGIKNKSLTIIFCIAPTFALSFGEECLSSCETFWIGVV